MPVREIIAIDEELCDGCGLCVPACAEGAIQLVDGKARLVKDSYCDGLGACLGECPQGAITIINREADDFDEVAVEDHLASASGPDSTAPIQMMPQAASGCPGAALRQLQNRPRLNTTAAESPSGPSHLTHWPVQLMLVPPHAPFLKNADILICADCVPFAVPDFHARWLNGRAVVVGCPKLDDLQHYLDKMAAMFSEADPASITVLKMEVPCCHGIAQAAQVARDRARPETPMSIHTLSITGELLESVECATESSPVPKHA
jgi:Fe-S-cluster-containing hydrogenase component 2